MGNWVNQDWTGNVPDSEPEGGRCVCQLSNPQQRSGVQGAREERRHAGLRLRINTLMYGICIPESGDEQIILYANMSLEGSFSAVSKPTYEDDIHFSALNFQYVQDVRTFAPLQIQMSQKNI